MQWCPVLNFVEVAGVFYVTFVFNELSDMFFFILLMELVSVSDRLRLLPVSNDSGARRISRYIFSFNFFQANCMIFSADNFHKPQGIEDNFASVNEFSLSIAPLSLSVF